MSTVLLIADSEWVINDVHATLSSPDREIVVLNDPVLVSATAADVKPDVAVIDLQVGAMGGMAIVRELHDGQALGQVPHFPTVLLLDRTADRFLARRSGANASVVKPFSAQELRSAVTRILL
ncbi:MAG: response regulator [Acidimicrobiia bacterium]|nr:response regulator [Acidimicrobiia bacterium]